MGPPPASLAAGPGQPVGGFTSSDREAAEELFNACYPRLAGWVRRLVDNDEVAHDIAAEAFARLLGRWSRVDNPHSYLYGLAANLVSDHWRKSGREQRAVTKLAGAGASCHRVQEVDVRALIEARRRGCAQRSCSTTTPDSRSGRLPRCWASRRAPSRPTCITRACG